MHVADTRLPLCFPKTISERNGDAGQTRLGWLQRPRFVALPDLEAHPCLAPMRADLCLPKIISGRNGGAAQTRLGWLQRPRSVTLPDLEAHPCPAPSACGPHCGTPRKKKESVAGAPRQRPASSQALPTHGANQTFHIRILPRRSRRDRSVADAHRPHPGRRDAPVPTANPKQ